MELSDLHTLQNPEIREWIRSLEEENPEKLALKLPRRGTVPSALIATQVALRKKAKSKIPSFFQAGCLFDSLPLEQCSSEETANLKTGIQGKRMLDLTCGMGVDTFFFSRLFEEVIALEPEPLRHELATFNFSLLNASNIRVVLSRAEEFLSQLRPDEQFDWVYADPARRDEKGKKIFLLKDCSPDIESLLSNIFSHTRNLLVKASPLLDITAARNLPGIRKITVLASQGECREILLEMGADHNETARIEARWISGGKVFRFSESGKSALAQEEIPQSGFILEADVSLYKAGLAADFFSDTFGESVKMNHPSGYGFSQQLPENASGLKTYEIIQALPFKPSGWKKILKAAGHERVLLTKRNLDIPLDQIRKEMRMPEGGNIFLLMTSFGKGKRGAWLCRRLREEQGSFTEKSK